MTQAHQARTEDWTAERIQEVRARLDEHMRTHDVSRSDVGTAISMSKSTVSMWMRDCYNGSGSAVAGKIEGYLGEYDAQLKTTLVAPKVAQPKTFIATTAASQVLMTLKYSRKMRDIGVVYGDPGTGKTYALRHYQAQHPNEVVLVTAAPHHRRPASIIADLAEAVGMPPIRRNRQLRGIFADLVAALVGRDLLIIVDEAQHLSLAALEELRSVHDAADIPLVLAGNEDVYDQLHGRGQAAFAQLFSRVSLVARIENRLTVGDIRAIARWHVGHELDDDSIEYLLKLGRKAGALRAVAKCTRLAAVLLEGNPDLDTLAALEGASTMMMPAA